MIRGVIQRNIESVRVKIWRGDKVQFHSIAIMLLVPLLPALTLGLVLFDLVEADKFLSSVITDNAAISWASFILLSLNFLYALLLADKASDRPPEQSNKEEKDL